MCSQGLTEGRERQTKVRRERQKITVRWSWHSQLLLFFNQKQQSTSRQVISAHTHAHWDSTGVIIPLFQLLLAVQYHFNSLVKSEQGCVCACVSVWGVAPTAVPYRSRITATIVEAIRIRCTQIRISRISHQKIMKEIKLELNWQQNRNLTSFIDSFVSTDKNLWREPKRCINGSHSINIQFYFCPYFFSFLFLFFLHELSLISIPLSVFLKKIFDLYRIMILYKLQIFRRAKLGSWSSAVWR